MRVFTTSWQEGHVLTEVMKQLEFYPAMLVGTKSKLMDPADSSMDGSVG